MVRVHALLHSSIRLASHALRTLPSPRMQLVHPLSSPQTLLVSHSPHTQPLPLHTVALIANKRWLDHIWFFHGIGETHEGREFIAALANVLVRRAYIANERVPVGYLYILRRGIVVKLWRFLRSAQHTSPPPSVPLSRRLFSTHHHHHHLLYHSHASLFFPVAQLREGLGGGYHTRRARADRPLSSGRADVLRGVHAWPCGVGRAAWSLPKGGAARVDGEEEGDVTKGLHHVLSEERGKEGQVVYTAIGGEWLQ